MPHTSSAKKSSRQDAKLRLHNRETKKELKIEIKKYLVALKTGTVEEAETQLKVCHKKLDKAGARHVIHPNAAGRKKSRLTLKLMVKKNPKPVPAKA